MAATHAFIALSLDTMNDLLTVRQCNKSIDTSHVWVCGANSRTNTGNDMVVDSARVLRQSGITGDVYIHRLLLSNS
jgi:hypothetical protein